MARIIWEDMVKIATLLILTALVGGILWAQGKQTMQPRPVQWERCLPDGSNRMTCDYTSPPEPRLQTNNGFGAVAPVLDCGMVNGVLVSKPCKQYAEEIAKRLETYEKPSYTSVTVESSGVRVMAHLDAAELAAIRAIVRQELSAQDTRIHSIVREELRDAAGRKP